jgi:alcohol dehydrogenase
MLTCGATAGYHPRTDIRDIRSYELDIVGSNGWTRADLTRLLEVVSEGRLKPVMDRVMPLSQAREAFGMLERREVFGKLLLRP